MNTMIVTFNPRIPRLMTIGVNLTVVAGLIFAMQAIVKSPPMLADELKLAQNNIVAPFLEKEKLKENIIKELTIEERSRKYDETIRKKYINGTIYDIDKGIKHIKLVRTYQGQPVKINVVEINKDLNSNLEITPKLASNKLTSRSTISNIAKEKDSIIAINGTYFKPQTGVPLGTLMINGKMYTGPIYDRVAMGFFANGYDMARVQLNAQIKSGKISTKVDNVNQPRMLSTYVLAYTPEWGNYAPPSPKYGQQIAVADGKIVKISTEVLEIPKNGFVIVGPTDKLKEFEISNKAELKIGTSPEWNDVEHIISGGPYLVKNGEVFIDMTAQKLGAIGGKNPRTAIGYTKEGTLILVTIDGRENASVGMTLTELGNFMKSIGCVNAMNLDGGGSTVMYVKGKVVNNPQVKGGIALSNAITVNKKSL